MNFPVRGKSGEYFLVLKNGVPVPFRNLKTVVPKTVKCERKSSVAKTHSSLESFQIDLSSQPASAVNAISATAPFLMQSVSVQNLPVKTLYDVQENVKYYTRSIKLDTTEKVKSHEIPVLQETSSKNSTVKGNLSECSKLSQIAISESRAVSEVKAANVLDIAHTAPIQYLPTNTTYLSKTIDYSNVAVDTNTYETSDSFLINIPTKHLEPETSSATVQSPPFQDLSTLVFFDLETTGLPGRGAPKVQITELSMFAVSRRDFEESCFPDLQDVRVVNKMCICVRPTVGVCPMAAKVTGLNDSNLQDHQVFDKDTANMIQIFIAKLPKPVCLLAHNGNRFDFPLLKAELQNAGVQLTVDILTADTLNAFRSIGRSSSNGNTPIPIKRKKSDSKTERPSYALHKLYVKYFNEEAANCHSAEGDCMTLMMLCHKMKSSILPWIGQNARQFTSIKPMWS